MQDHRPPNTTLKQKLGSLIIPRLPFCRRTFELFRFELGLFFRKMCDCFNPFYHFKICKLRRSKHLSLNVGTGGRGLPNWVNTDALYHRDTTLILDIRKKMPFADDSVKRIFAEQIIEHIDFRDEIPRCLAEFYRILEVGGTLRVIVPDAERYLEAYVSKSPAKWKELGWDLQKLPDDLFTPMHVINHVFHQMGEHYFGYDFETMEWALKKAGFKKILKQSYQKSVDSELAIDQPNHALYSLYVEAIK
jgi:predicted SAM-dependent methyltransferase